MGTIFVDKLDPQSGTSLEIGSSGDTITIPSGATITNNGTQTGFGGTNTPAFHAKTNTGLSTTNNTETKLVFGQEDFDTASAYDVSNGRFTVPSGQGGKYFLYSRVRVDSATDSEIYDLKFFKNGSEILMHAANQYRYTSAHVSGILDLSASDYIEVYVTLSGGLSLRDDARENHFGGYKLIE